MVQFMKGASIASDQYATNNEQSNTPTNNVTTALSLNLQNKLWEAINIIKQSGKNVVITYRKNETYDSMIEDMKKLLEVEKISYTLQAFERGTEKEEITSRIAANEDIYTDSIYLTDNTTISYPFQRKEKNEESVILTLDDHYSELFHKYSSEAIKAPNLSIGEYNEAASISWKEDFKNLIKAGFATKQPKRIVIITKNLADHNETATFLWISNDTYEDNMPDYEKNYSKYQTYEKGFCKRIAKVLADIIQSTEFTWKVKIIDEKDIRDHNKKDVWVIRDRHSLRGIKSEDLDAIDLKLPLPDMLTCMVNAWLINEKPSDQSICNDILITVSERLKEKIAKW